MPNKADYLLALANAKQNAIQSNGVLVNPNNASTQVGVMEDTSSQPMNTSANRQGAWYDKVFGFIDDVAREFGSGFVRGWEGMGDFVLTGVSAIGEAMGNDMSDLNDFIKLDLGGLAGNWTQAYMNFTPWGIANNIKNYGDSEYWKNFGQDTIANLDMAFGGFGGHGQEDIDKIMEHNRQYAINKGSTLTDMGKSGEFIGGIAGSIGQMLPSIMVGNAVGGALTKAQGVETIANLSKGGQALVKTAQLGSFGLGAGGQGSQEALNEGANAKQALAYGAVTGAIEVGTELASDGLGKLGAKVVGESTKLGKWLGNSKIGGFDLFRKGIGTTTIGELSKNMIEEGLEEVASELLSPLAKSIYKGSDALKDYGTKDYWEGVVLSGASGAVMGGIMEGASQASIYTALGKDGVKVVKNIQEMNETQAKLISEYKNANSNEARQEVLNKMEAQDNAQLLKDTVELINNLSERQQANLVKLYVNPEKAVKEFEQNNNVQVEMNEMDLQSKLDKGNISLGEYIAQSTENAKKKIDTSKYTDKEKQKVAVQQFINDVTYFNGFESIVDEARQFTSAVAGKDINIEFKKGIEGHSYIDNSTGNIVIDSKYKSRLHTALTHEALVHALHHASPEAFKQLKAYLTSNEKGKALYQQVMNQSKTAWGEDLSKAKDKNGNVYGTLENFIDTEYKGSSKEIIEEEKLAHFMQEMVKNYAEFEDLMKGNNGKTVVARFLDKVGAKFDKTGTKELFNEFKKVVDSVRNADKTPRIEVGRTYKLNSDGTLQVNNGELVKASKKVATREKSSNKFDTTKSIAGVRLNEEVFERQNAILEANKDIKKISIIQGSEDQYNEIKKDSNVRKVIIEGADYLKITRKYGLTSNIPTTLVLNDYARKLAYSQVKSIFRSVAMITPQMINYTGSYESGVRIITDTVASKKNGTMYYVVNIHKTDRTYTDKISKTQQEAYLSVMSEEDIAKTMNPFVMDNKKFFIGAINVKSHRIVETAEYNVNRNINDYFSEETKKRIADKELARFYINPHNNKLQTSTGARVVEYTNDGAKVEDGGLRQSLKNKFKLDLENIRYSKDINENGEWLTEQQQEYFYDSKVRNEWGELLVMYHGTPNASKFQFTSKRMGYNGLEYGAGYYLTNDAQTAYSYQFGGGKVGKVITAYVDIQKPINVEKHEMKVKDFVELIDSFTEEEIAGILEYYGLDYYGGEDVSKMINKFADNLIKYNNSDYTSIEDLYEACSKFADMSFERFHDMLTQVTGYDGYIWKMNDGSTMTVAFRSNQIKYIDNLKPTKNEDIRYSKVVEQFDNNKNNVRVSINDNEFISTYNKIIKNNNYDGYLAVEDINIREDILKNLRLNNKILFTIKKAKMLDVNHKHNVDGEVFKNVINNAFNEPNAIIYDRNINEKHPKPTYNFISKIFRKDTNNPYYLVLEFDSSLKNQIEVEANVIKSVFDRSRIEKYLDNIRENKKVGLTLLYTEQDAWSTIDGFLVPTSNITQDNSVVNTDIKKSKSIYDIEDDFDLDYEFDYDFERFEREQQQLKKDRRNRYQREYRADRKNFEQRNAFKQSQFDDDISNLKTFSQQQAYRNSGKVALFSQARLKDEIERYGSSFETDYAKAYIAEISPREFLEVTPPTLENNLGVEMNNELDVEKLSKEIQSPHLYIDFDKNKIVNHEGRHRMFALMKNGYTKAQVLVLFKNTDEFKHNTTKQNISLKAQNVMGRNWLASDYQLQLELTPLSARYSQELLDSQKEADLKYSKSVEENKTSYINFATTQDIVNNLQEQTKIWFGEDTKVSYPKSFSSFVSKAFTEINSVKNIDLEARNIANMFLETTIKYKGSVYGEDVGKLSIKELLTPTEQESLVSAISQIIRTSPQTPARDNAVRQLKISLERLENLSKEYRNMLKPSVNLIKSVIEAEDLIGRGYKIDNNAVDRDGFKFLLKPFADLRDKNGRFNIRGFAENIRAVLNQYTEENFNGDNGLQFYPEIVNMYDELLDSLGEPVEQTLHNKKGEVVGTRTIYGNLDATQLALANNVVKAIQKLIADNTTKKTIVTMPTAKATYQVVNTMSYGKRVDAISKAIRSWKRGFAPSYIVAREILGGSSALSEKVTTEVQKAQNNKTMYNGLIHDKINQELKNLKIANKIEKRVEINGHSMTYGQALYLYLSMEANQEQLMTSGATYLDKNGRPVELFGKGEVVGDEVFNEAYDNFVEELDKKLSPEMKKFASFISNLLNGQLKTDYKNWYENTFGKFNGRNELDGTYFPLYRYVKRESSVEMMARVAGGVFINAKSRMNNTHSVLIGDALSTLLTYSERLSNEIYIKPIYKEIVSALNQKVEGDKTLKQVIAEKTDPQDLSHLTRILKSIVGVDTENRSTILDGIMSHFAIAKLSLNIGSALKQYASIWTSNLPISVSTKALFKRVFGGQAYQTLFNDLVNEIGGLKYRKSGSGVVQSNVGTVKGTTEKIANAGMFMLTANDYFTISVGVYGLIGTAINEYNYNIETDKAKIKKFVVDNWAEFELSQIGNTALSQSAISRGDYDGIVKAVFGFLQGANRASFGSQINKLATFLRNHKLIESDVKNRLSKAKSNQEQAKSNLDSAKKDLDKARQEYFEGGRKQELLDDYNNAKAQYNQAEQQYINANAELEGANAQSSDYSRYKQMGGKSIPVNMVAGLMAQGVFVALVSELMKHIKGKKDWDDWEVKDMALNIGLSVSADWIPFVNTFSSLLQGYETSIPTTELLNQISTLSTTLKNKNWRVAIRQIALAVGDMTGLPFQTVYQYMYGIVKASDPESAWKLNNLFYNQTEQSANRSLQVYAGANKLKGTQAMVSVLMDNYKTKSDDEIDKELATLYMSGYRAIPSSIPSTYTNEKGEEVKLSKSQLQMFKETYDTSYGAIKELLTLGEYRSKTQEQQAKTIKSIYSAYYEYAKAKSVGVMPTTRLGKMLYYSNGKLNIAKLVNTINYVSQIKENGKKTKKELTIEYINKQKYLSKSEKILTMLLCGYSLSDNNKQLLTSYLRKLGMNNKAIKELLD